MKRKISQKADDKMKRPNKDKDSNSASREFNKPDSLSDRFARLLV